MVALGGQLTHDAALHSMPRVAPCGASLHSRYWHPAVYTRSR